MDRNTVLAIILSGIIITVGFMIQNKFTPTEGPSPSGGSPSSQGEGSSPSEAPLGPPVTQFPSPSGAESPSPAGAVVPVSGEELPSSRSVTLENEVFSAVFSTRGAVLKSLKLKKHRDKDGFVEMVKSGSSGESAFELSFGGPAAPPVTADFFVRQKDEFTVEFYRDFEIAGYADSAFRLVKTFSLRRGEEYLMQVDISLENSRNQYLPLNFDSLAYTLNYGPQIGPDFEKLDGRYDFRNFYVYSEGKRTQVEVDAGAEKDFDKKASWFGVSGKYFTVLAAPVFSDYKVRFSSRPVSGLVQSSSFFISKPFIKSSRNTDTYRFYLGPKLSDTLGMYNDAGKNAFGIQDMHFDEIVDSNFFLGWLEFILKALLQLFYNLVPNWGVAIILVTVVVKIVTFPLTQKSFKSTSKMQSFAPKLEELKKKYKDNPGKMNQELAAIYKKEGINPLSGCLPMLLQIPIFLAMYGLFSTHFDLRGAAFLPPWITDLSAPDSVWNFAPKSLPFLGWSDLRLLPILFVATQLISSKMMQTPSAVSNTQMKMMTYGIPIVFFFVLYDVPSGLLVYWIVMNILTVVQQYIVKMRKAGG